jgi:hypothetical protein
MQCRKYVEVFQSVKYEKYLKQIIWEDHVKRNNWAG